MSTEAPPAPPQATLSATPPATPAASPGGSAIPEPYYKDLFQSDGGVNTKALDRLPDHLKGVRSLLERQKNIDGILQSWEHSNTLASRKALAPIAADAPEPVRAERKALLDTINGVPAAAKDYGIARPQDFPEAHWDQPLADKFTEWAHKNSVSPAAAKELIGVQMEAVKGQLTQQSQYEQDFWNKEQQTFDGIIKQANIPSDRAASLVEKGAIALGLDLTNERTKTFLKGSDARLMAMRHAIAIGEDSFVQGDAKASENDPEAQASDIVHNKANPLYEQYWNREGKFPRATAEAARAKVEELQRMAAAKNPPARRDRR